MARALRLILQNPKLFSEKDISRFLLFLERTSFAAMEQLGRIFARGLCGITRLSG